MLLQLFIKSDERPRLGRRRLCLFYAQTYYQGIIKISPRGHTYTIRWSLVMDLHRRYLRPWLIRSCQTRDGNRFSTDVTTYGSNQYHFLSLFYSVESNDVIISKTTNRSQYSLICEAVNLISFLID